MGQPLIGQGEPYTFEKVDDRSPMDILIDWTSSTDMQQISIGMLKDWFKELRQLEDKMREFDYENGLSQGDFPL